MSAAAGWASRVRVTPRVIGFLLLVAAVPVAAYYVLRWYAYDNWIVVLQGNQVVVTQGQPGGVLWFHPRVVDRTGITRSQVTPTAVVPLKAGVQKSSLHDAQQYVANITMSSAPTRVGDHYDHAAEADDRHERHHDHDHDGPMTCHPRPAAEGAQRRLRSRCNLWRNRVSTRAATRSPTWWRGGGMAQVYRAIDLQLDRPVALKVLFPELSVDRTFVERFRREAQAAANLSHPNIVPVFDWVKTTARTSS